MFDDYNAFRRLVLAICRRSGLNHADAADISQEVFLKLWLHAGEVRNKKGWLSYVTRNAIVSQYRDRQPAQPLVVDVAKPVVEDDIDGEMIQAAIDGLTEPQAFAIRRFYFDDLSLLELAEETGTPINTIKTRMFAARQKLAEALS